MHIACLVLFEIKVILMVINFVYKH